ncbi:hypothetical protein TNCV_3188021 [Trichonephila clavipes]|nr:hypothetical protein TNCV_3188021 [Trichonephila clavipes]
MLAFPGDVLISRIAHSHLPDSNPTNTRPESKRALGAPYGEYDEHQLLQLLHKSSNGWWSVILHEYCTIHILLLLKCRKDRVTQNCFIPLGSNSAGNGPAGMISSKKDKPTTKASVIPHQTVTFQNKEVMAEARVDSWSRKF